MPKNLRDPVPKPRTVTIISSRIVPLETLVALEASSGSRPAKLRDDRRAAIVPQIAQDVTEITLDAFQASIDNTTDALSTIFASAFEKAFGEFQLNKVEVDLEISADGKVGFMGSGIAIKGSSSLKLKFARRKA
jgi:hypothetical protein